MKKGIISAMLCGAMLLSVGNMSAKKFFDTSEPEDLFNIGVRTGFNMATASLSSNNMRHTQTSWGTGFDAGAVVNINFRDYLTIQPGFFYQSRSQNYGFIKSDDIKMGHALNYSFYVPVLASVRFNVTDNLRWSVDFGPYFAFGVGKSDKGWQTTLDGVSPYDDGYYKARHRNGWGFKMGSGMNVLQHYYVGIHYMAGASNVWKVDGRSGRGKAWTFTLGYDF